MNVEAKWRGGMHFQANTPSHHTIDIDSGPANSVTFGPGPMELVLQAIAGCTGMDILSILKKKRKEPEEFDIRIEAERSDEHPKVFKKVVLHYKVKRKDLTKSQVEQAIKLSVDKYCSVLAMVRSSAEVSWDYELEE